MPSTRWTIFGSAFLTALSVSFATAPAAAAGGAHNSRPAIVGEHLLGGVDMQGYCISHGYIGAVLQGGTAYDWRCMDGSGRRDQISMTDACRWQYGTSDVIDRPADFYNPYSWQCWGTADGGRPGT